MNDGYWSAPASVLEHSALTLTLTDSCRHFRWKICLYMCLVRALKYYLNATQEHRRHMKQLFISFKPTTDITQTIFAGWLKTPSQKATVKQNSLRLSGVTWDLMRSAPYHHHGISSLLNKTLLAVIGGPKICLRISICMRDTGIYRVYSSWAARAIVSQ